MKYVNLYKIHFLNKNFDSKMFFYWQSLKNIYIFLILSINSISQFKSNCKLNQNIKQINI